MRWRAPVYLTFVLLAGAGCGSSEPPKAAAQPGDTLTTRQRQERLSTTPLPGAGGIGKALKVADSAAARNARLDSIR